MDPVQPPKASTRPLKPVLFILLGAAIPVWLQPKRRKILMKKSLVASLKRRRNLRVIALAIATSGLHAQPAADPGAGLAQHSFLYAGESHDRRIFIVRQGKISWNYDDPAGKGEISDAVMFSNGNILFAHQYGVSEITPDKKVVWNYDAPPGREVHTAVPIGNERILFIENGDPAMLRVVNIVTGKTEKELPVQVKHPVSVHAQFRHARLTSQGTLLLASMQLNKVVELDSDGNELWSFPAVSPWGATPLANGNVLMTDKLGVREVTRRGDSVWTFSPSDVPGYPFANLQQAWRLPNGNTLVNNWASEWSKSPENGTGTVQALELTPAKQVVWVLRSWTPPNNLGHHHPDS